jgi:hypothetical protein
MIESRAVLIRADVLDFGRPQVLRDACQIRAGIRDRIAVATVSVGIRLFTNGWRCPDDPTVDGS